MTSSHIVVYITVPSWEVGHQIADALLESRIVACVNILPQITSIYRWESAINSDEELLLIAKTRTTHFNALATTVRRIHPYEVPEVIAIPIVAGSKEYLTWIDSETA